MGYLYVYMKLLDIILENRTSVWSMDKIIEYVSNFKTLVDFTNDKNYSTIKTYTYRNGGSELWKNITSQLVRTKPRLNDNDEVTTELIKKFPQWDLSNISYYWSEDGKRYLNGLMCHIKDENGEEHGVSDNLFVKDLKRRGNGCRKCGVENRAGKRRVNVEEWIEKFPKEQGYIFDPSKFYYRTDLHQKTLFVKDVICTKHKPHFIFANDGVNVHNIRNNKTGCPICGKKESKGEKLVNQYLIELGYDVSKQKRFPGCFGFKGQKYCDLLKFDAHIFKNDDKEICVEFDGVQHYKPIPFFGGQDALESLQERDKIKTDYCLNNNIELIRIPYWEIKNIKSILNDKIGHNNKSLKESKLSLMGVLEQIL